MRLDVIPAWPQFNPSIAADGDGFRMIVRTANHRLEDGVYHFLEPGNVIRTINYVVALDAALRVTDVGVLEDASEGPPVVQAASALGFEDCRLLRVGDRWVATATVRDRNAQERCEIALLELDGARVAAVHMAGSTPGRDEKNWMAFADGGTPHFVYGLDPPAVLRWDAAVASAAVVAGDPSPDLLRAQSIIDGQAHAEAAGRSSTRAVRARAAQAGIPPALCATLRAIRR